MAVVAVWKCDRDGSLFDNKKEAEAYDKMFELAETITLFLNHEISDIDEQTSVKIGLALARRRDDLLKACKGKTDALLPQTEPEDSEEEATTDPDLDTPPDEDREENVTELASGQ